MFAIVDECDFESLSAFKWYAYTNKKNFYAVRSIYDKSSKARGMVFMHRQILGLSGKIQGDHKNGNTLNNTRLNLRPLTNTQNNRAHKRKIKSASSKFRGVYWNSKNKKWIAAVGVNRRPIYLGSFEIDSEAARAYDKKAIELGFEKEALNFNYENSTQTNS